MKPGGNGLTCTRTLRFHCCVRLCVRFFFLFSITAGSRGGNAMTALSGGQIKSWDVGAFVSVLHFMNIVLMYKKKKESVWKIKVTTLTKGGTACSIWVFSSFQWGVQDVQLTYVEDKDRYTRTFLTLCFNMNKSKCTHGEVGELCICSMWKFQSSWVQWLLALPHHCWLYCKDLTQRSQREATCAAGFIWPAGGDTYRVSVGNLAAVKRRSLWVSVAVGTSASRRSACVNAQHSTARGHDRSQEKKRFRLIVLNDFQPFPTNDTHDISWVSYQ